MQRSHLNTLCRWSLLALLAWSAPVEQCIAQTPAAPSQPPSFELDIQPILVANGCSVGACHGKSRGQNGFALSLLCFDPDFDYASLTLNARGRRVFPAAPEKSLLLTKGAALTAHGGGQRLVPGSDEYQTILRWIAAGAPRRVENEPTLVAVELTPQEITLQPKAKQQLKVVARYSDGAVREVTSRSTYLSNENAIVATGKTGLLTAGSLPGEATIMARYMSFITTTNVTIPVSQSTPTEYYAALPRANFIDELVWDKLQSVGLKASPPADDATFLRRAHLDIIGRLPTPEETRAFLADPAPNKRSQLVDALLARPEYADHWSGKWIDLLRPNPYRVGIKAVFNFDEYIRDSFRTNKPFDQFSRELIAAKGNTFKNGAAVLFRDRREPAELTTMIGQLFLGTRLDCAKCHHHPFEKWGQDDFYHFAAFFARIGRKGTGLSPPISGSDEQITVSKKGEVKHPLTDAVLAPRTLDGQLLEIPEGSDPREALAEWITSDKNDLFAQTIANRIWADLMGRGLVEPVDDLRATNPPSNPALLAALANHLRENKFDLKSLIRVVCNSQAYALSAMPFENNLGDTRNYSRRYRTRLRAETLADALVDITGVSEKYAAMPPEGRASQLWTFRINALTLDTFGRPDPNQDPPCERLAEGAVTQALHMMNGAQLATKVADDQGRVAKLAAEKSPEQIAEELYLACYSRFPTPAEQAVARDLFAGDANKRLAAEDLLWSLLNTPEFLFNH